MTTQPQEVDTKAQVVTTQQNREVGPPFQQNDSIMAYRLRDITR